MNIFRSNYLCILNTGRFAFTVAILAMISMLLLLCIRRSSEPRLTSPVTAECSRSQLIYSLSARHSREVLVQAAGVVAYVGLFLFRVTLLSVDGSVIMERVSPTTDAAIGF